MNYVGSVVWVNVTGLINGMQSLDGALDWKITMILQKGANTDEWENKPKDWVSEYGGLNKNSPCRFPSLGELFGKDKDVWPFWRRYFSGCGL